MNTPENDPLWIASIHLTNHVIGERMFAPVLAAALREYADSLDALRPVANFEVFVSTNSTKITAAIGFFDGTPAFLQSGLGVTAKHATTVEGLNMNRDDSSQEQAGVYNEQRTLIHWNLKAAPVVADTSVDGLSPQRDTRNLFQVARSCNSLQFRVGSWLRLSLDWGARQRVQSQDCAGV